MIGMESVIEELEAMEKSSLLRIILQLGSLSIPEDLKSDDQEIITTEGLREYVHAEIVYNAVCKEQNYLS